jgi:uncharacterized protein YjbI with pentapeptide repeats
LVKRVLLMIEIKHRLTGEVLLRVEADTLYRVDLADVDLINANLMGVDLSEAILFGTNLSGSLLHGARILQAHLARARLVDADLRRVDFTYTNLGDADLRDAILHGADLTCANLSGANLSGANLYAARVNNTHLVGTDLSNVTMGQTYLTHSVTLHQALGLDTIQHRGPSYLDNLTLRACVAHLPDVFLKGVGYTNYEIETLRALYTDAIQYYSCFLSHAAEDGEFANRLRRDLIDNDVSCWHYRYDMRGGDLWRDQINKAIKIHDKLVLICSAQSLPNINVVEEVIAAIETEKRTGSKKLFPISLDDFIFSDRMTNLAKRKTVSGEWSMNWVTYVRAFHIPDFSRWKDHDVYKVEFDKLLRDLKEPAKRPKGPTKRKTRTKA